MITQRNFTFCFQDIPNENIISKLHNWSKSWLVAHGGILPSGGVRTWRFCYQWGYPVQFDSMLKKVQKLKALHLRFNNVWPFVLRLDTKHIIQVLGKTLALKVWQKKRKKHFSLKISFPSDQWRDQLWSTTFIYSLHNLSIPLQVHNSVPYRTLRVKLIFPRDDNSNREKNKL